jgi:DNA primase
MIIKIKDKLRDNPELIIHILNELGCENIKPLKGHEIRWGSSNGSKINIETLSYTSFSHNHKGDVITMVSLLKEIDLGQAIKWLAKELNLSYEYSEKVEVTLPFGGFFKNYSKVKDNDVNPPKIYPIERLKEYTGRLNTLWLEDNISLQTQELFDIGLDFETNRIAIGWKDVNSELVGIMGRLNKKELTDKDTKYLPIIPFNKSKVLYGLDVNYSNILDNGTIIIVESEKSVLRGYELGYRNIVALGGNNISERQAALIKSLCVNVVISLDEGIELTHSIEQAKKCKIENPFFSNEVYVMEVDDLPKKHSIFDMNKEVIDNYLKNKLIYI